MPAEDRSLRDGPVAGLLLAAGTSSRMGANKMLLTIDGEPMIRRAARRAAAGGLSPLIVVLGHEAERARAQLVGLDCRVVVHPGYEQGVTTSVHAGLRALPEEAAAVMVVLADMPHVTSEMVEEMIARYRASTAPLVISDYEGVNAPPMLYDRCLVPELLAMHEGGCGKQVVKRHKAEAEVVTWPAAALADVDRPEDYERARVHAAAGLEAR